MLYLTFRAHRNGRDELIGTDTFVVRDGLIRAHTFYATTPSPTDDGRRPVVNVPRPAVRPYPTFPARVRRPGHRVDEMDDPRDLMAGPTCQQGIEASR